MNLPALVSVATPSILYFMTTPCVSLWPSRNNYMSVLCHNCSWPTCLISLWPQTCQEQSHRKGLSICCTLNHDLHIVCSNTTLHILLVLLHILASFPFRRGSDNIALSNQIQFRKQGWNYRRRYRPSFMAVQFWKWNKTVLRASETTFL